MEWLGRYSMTDVMVLALIIFYMNSQGYTEARVLPGVYCFAASALMTMAAYGWANAVAPQVPASVAPTASDPRPEPKRDAAPVRLSVAPPVPALPPSPSADQRR